MNTLFLSWVGSRWDSLAARPFVAALDGEIGSDASTAADDVTCAWMMSRREMRFLWPLGVDRAYKHDALIKSNRSGILQKLQV